MIQDLKISYLQDSNINVTISICNSNETYITPYDLVELITKIINDGQLNASTVISQLTNDFN